MKGDNFGGLKKWRRPEGRPISISSVSMLDYIWSSVLLKRCAVLREPPCKHLGVSTLTKITNLTFVASHICVRYAHISPRLDAELEHLNLTAH